MNFKDFTATRMSDGNSLKWITATESNSKGFYIERFTNGTWDNIGYVATKAEGGNSGIELNYSFSVCVYLPDPILDYTVETYQVCKAVI